nr:hypothetical protein BgiMline_026807 [Biomphalaria glabrata]
MYRQTVLHLRYSGLLNCDTSPVNWTTKHCCVVDHETVVEPPIPYSGRLFQPAVFSRPLIDQRKHHLPLQLIAALYAGKPGGGNESVHVFELIGNEIVNIFELIGNEIVNIFELIGNEIVNIFELIGNEIVHVFELIGNEIVNIFELIGNEIVNVFELIGNEIVNIFELIGNTWNKPTKRIPCY